MKSLHCRLQKQTFGFPFTTTAPTLWVIHNQRFCVCVSRRLITQALRPISCLCSQIKIGLHKKTITRCEKSFCVVRVICCNIDLWCNHKRKRDNESARAPALSVSKYASPAMKTSWFGLFYLPLHVHPSNTEQRRIKRSSNQHSWIFSI